MTMMNRARVTVQAIAAAALCAAASTSLADSTMTGDVKPLTSLHFTADDDVKCLSDAIETGDPETGPSTILLKATPGCVVPWHYHTAVEQLIVIRGDVLTEMSGHAAGLLSAGGFAVMGSKVPHQFVCQEKSECLIVVIFDRKYDIYWGKGNGASPHPHNVP